jgi:hypothetical protein
MPDETTPKGNTGDVLDLIMRDVLAGIRGFTLGTCRKDPTGGEEISGIDRERKSQSPVASIIPFPRNNSDQ